MGEVMKFPELQREEARLYDQTAALEEIYEALYSAHNMINELELRAREMEVTYEHKLKQYVAKIGILNTPIDLLKYSNLLEDYYYEQKDETPQ